MTMFQPPAETIIWRTSHWRVNHCLSTTLPGYLIASALHDAEWDTLPIEALAALGGVLATSVDAINACLHPRRVYVSRYGHTPGHTLHFHLIPVYDWLIDAFMKDERYHALEQFYAPSSGTEPDGADLTLFIWREYGEAQRRPAAEIDVTMATQMLRQYLSRSA